VMPSLRQSGARLRRKMALLGRPAFGLLQRPPRTRLRCWQRELSHAGSARRKSILPVLLEAGEDRSSWLEELLNIFRFFPGGLVVLDHMILSRASVGAIARRAIATISKRGGERYTTTNAVTAVKNRGTILQVCFVVQRVAECTRPSVW